jgi:prepilin-type N-terminal cleavage/methylation domain-containing protein/prepilin-type processing-associated H-X9-DG protein
LIGQYDGKKIPLLLGFGYDAAAMRKLFAQGANKAFTLVELLVVVAVIAILIAMMLPARTGSRRAPGAICMNHLKQTALGFWLYAGDNHDKFPMQVSVTNGGTKEFLYSNHTFPHYEKLSSCIPRPELLICPTDKNRRAATNYNELADKNLSYFLNADFSTNNPIVSILAGDRNLEADGQPVKPGLFILTTNLNLGWTHELHLTGGNLAFADGHVEFCKSTNLNSVVQRQSIVTNRLSVP